MKITLEISESEIRSMIEKHVKERYLNSNSRYIPDWKMESYTKIATDDPSKSFYSIAMESKEN